MSRKKLLTEENETKLSEISEQVLETPLDEKEANKIPVTQQLVLLSVILLLIFGSAITPKVMALIQKTGDAAATITAPIHQNVDAKQILNETTIEPFSDITITAKAAYVWDINDQKALYKKEESKKLPLASVTKLMTALVANEVLDKNESIKIGEMSIRQDGDSGLSLGEVFNRLTLSDLVLMSSSNDGAFALASAAGSKLEPNGNGPNTFVTAMNIRAKEIGLSDTTFRNPTGLDISPVEGGAYGSARDMAFLMEYIVKNEPDILTFTRESEARVYSKTGEFHDAENTNYDIDQIPGLIGSKTGYTDLAGGNLVIAFNAGLNRPIVLVVLGSTQDARFTDIEKLVKETQEYVSREAQ